ncbi:MAG: hypothetical protein KDB01_27385, partial [Planctomycetaceae bacterium]|nr:hypothetical protein [Planctomycetaceae bacterium]
PVAIDNIYGEVDTKVEEDAILSWAEKHPRKVLSGGQMSHVPRTVIPLDLINIPNQLGHTGR